MAVKAKSPAPSRKSKGSPQLRISEDVLEQIQGRLRRVEGQVQAIQRMIAERRDCHAIAQQMSAARAALDRATVQLMTTSMAECLKPNGHADSDELSRLTETFLKLLS
jgi:CsoR family transcriptional regulator, copper-sensing transcriptional repressor